MILKKEISFEKSIPYHVIIRALEKIKVFLKEEDRFRFIFQMFAANIGSPSFNLHRKDIVKAGKDLLDGKEIQKNLIIIKHPPLISFLSFSFVINHSHFALVSNSEDGIPKYMQKLKGGFAKYFNLKYARDSNLFERPYKIIPIQTNFQLDAVLRYINIINPLDVYQPGWREKGLRNKKEAFKFLNKYQFSSFPDLFGKRNSKILAPKSVLERYLGEHVAESKTEFINFTEDYLQEKLIHYYPLFLEKEY